jgi:hypothetical protein
MQESQGLKWIATISFLVMCNVFGLDKILYMYIIYLYILQEMEKEPSVQSSIF